MSEDYEKERAQNILRNKQLLSQLQLEHQKHGIFRKDHPERRSIKPKHGNNTNNGLVPVRRSLRVAKLESTKPPKPQRESLKKDKAKQPTRISKRLEKQKRSINYRDLSDSDSGSDSDPKPRKLGSSSDSDAKESSYSRESSNSLSNNCSEDDESIPDNQSPSLLNAVQKKSKVEKITESSKFCMLDVKGLKGSTGRFIDQIGSLSQKQSVMAFANITKHLPVFNKMSGIQNFKNGILLFVNFTKVKSEGGQSGYQNELIVKAGEKDSSPTKVSLTWFAQPSQSLASDTIQNIIKGESALFLFVKLDDKNYFVKKNI